jgi:F-type H+-transporting ATPase subunit b
LIDLADENLEGRIAHHLMGKIKPMMPDLRRAAGRASEVVMTSQAALPPAVEAEVTAKLQDYFPQIAVRFETDKNQAPGVILQVGGAQLEWTVASYVAGLGAMIQEELAAGADAKVKSHER